MFKNGSNMQISYITPNLHNLVHKCIQKLNIFNFFNCNVNIDKVSWLILEEKLPGNQNLVSTKLSSGSKSSKYGN